MWREIRGGPAGGRGNGRPVRRGRDCRRGGAAGGKGPGVFKALDTLLRYRGRIERRATGRPWRSWRTCAGGGSLRHRQRDQANPSTYRRSLGQRRRPHDPGRTRAAGAEPSSAPGFGGHGTASRAPGGLEQSALLGQPAAVQRAASFAGGPSWRCSARASLPRLAAVVEQHDLGREGQVDAGLAQRVLQRRDDPPPREHDLWRRSRSTSGHGC